MRKQELNNKKENHKLLLRLLKKVLQELKQRWKQESREKRKSLKDPEPKEKELQLPTCFEVSDSSAAASCSPSFLAFLETRFSCLLEDSSKDLSVSKFGFES